MKEPDIGDFAVCIDGHKGIVTAVKNSPYGRMIIEGVSLVDFSR